MPKRRFRWSEPPPDEGGQGPGELPGSGGEPPPGVAPGSPPVSWPGRDRVSRERWTLGGAVDRYDRQARITGWEQRRLRDARVLVAGAGAIGNEALKLLAEVGVGRVTVIDRDRIEHTNLARTVLFRAADVGEAKALVAARRARELNPDIEVEGIAGDLEDDLGLGRVREADVILGCLDNLDARLAIARAARRMGRPWIDAAMDARAATVTVFPPGGPCYACNLGPASWRRHRERFSCGDGLLRAARVGRVATVATLASLVAALQVEALIAWLHRGAAAARSAAAGAAGSARELAGALPEALDLEPGVRLHVSLAPLEVRKIRLPERVDCPLHVPRWPDPIVAPFDAGVSARALAAWLASERGLRAEAFALGGELVTALFCPRCDERAQLCVPKRRLRVEAARCRRCCQQRRLECVEEVELADGRADDPLRALGVPERAILEARVADGGAPGAPGEAGGEAVFVELGLAPADRAGAASPPGDLRAAVDGDPGAPKER